jgi:hypothetical protein
VPTILAACSVLTDDEGANGVSDAGHAGGRLCDVDALGWRACVASGLIEVLKGCTGKRFQARTADGCRGARMRKTVAR